MEKSFSLLLLLGFFFLIDWKLSRGWDAPIYSYHSHFRCFENGVESGPSPQWKFIFLVPFATKYLVNVVLSTILTEWLLCSVINNVYIPHRVWNGVHNQQEIGGPWMCSSRVCKRNKFVSVRPLSSAHLWNRGMKHLKLRYQLKRSKEENAISFLLFLLLLYPWENYLTVI